MCRSPAPSARHLCRNTAKKISKLRQERHLLHMANTYTQIYIHVVFAVEGRQSLIKPEHNDELQKYITGIVSGQKQKLIAINNMPDHLHLLVGLRPDSSLSDLMRDVKAGRQNSSTRSGGLSEGFRGRRDLAHFHIRVTASAQSSVTSRTSKNITPRNLSVRNMWRCWKSSEWNTTRDIFSKRPRNNWPNMSLLTELEIW